MSTIKRLHDAGNLTRGRLRRMYAASGVVASGEGTTSASTGGTSTGTLGDKRGWITGITKSAKDLNKSLKLLNKALRKKDVNDIETIEMLAEKIDTISDYIESILDSSVDSSEMLKRVGVMAGEIIGIIDEFIGDSDDGLKNETPDDISVDNIPDAGADDETMSESDPEFDDNLVDDTDSDDGSDNNDGEEGEE